MSYEDDMYDGHDVHGLDELLGAYALDAIDDDERMRVEDYLTINPRAAAEVAEHREVATMLAYTGMDAPDSVWNRIERELDSSDRAPAPGPELAQVLEFGAGRRTHDDAPAEAPAPSPSRWGRSMAWAGGVAAAVVIAVAAVGVFGGSTSDKDHVVAAFEDAVAADSSLRTDLVAEGSDVSAVGVIDENGSGFVDASDLPALDAGLTYQLWGVLADTGDVVSMGIFGPDPEVETFTIDGAVSALAITIEQSPGVVSDGNPDGAYVGAFG